MGIIQDRAREVKRKMRGDSERLMAAVEVASLAALRGLVDGKHAKKVGKAVLKNGIFLRPDTARVLNDLASGCGMSVQDLAARIIEAVCMCYVTGIGAYTQKALPWMGELDYRRNVLKAITNGMVKDEAESG